MRNRSNIAFLLTLLVTLGVSLLPVHWRFGWSREVAALVRFPLRPFTHAGSALAEWLRPLPSPLEGTAGDPEEILEQLLSERDAFERLYRNEQQRARDLEEQLRQLKLLPEETRRLTGQSVVAPITARSPEPTGGIVELKFRGTGTVPEGTVGVYAGVHLIGRTVETDRRNVCQFLPLTAKDDANLVRGRVFPADVPDLPLDRAPAIQLEPDGAGGFRARPRRSDGVKPGDIVRLDDDTWPPTAQMMVIGRVTDVAENDAEPLRDEIRIEPTYSIQQIGRVTLLLEEMLDAARMRGNTP